MKLFEWMSETKEIQISVRKVLSMFLLMSIFVIFAIVGGAVGGVLGWLIFTLMMIAATISGVMAFVILGGEVF